MPICKKCNSNKNIKSGKVNGKQRYIIDKKYTTAIERDNSNIIWKDLQGTQK